MRTAARILMILLASLSFSCGTGGSDFAGGGTGGTGISSGDVTGFGSVAVSGRHFLTDDGVAPGFKTKKTVNGGNRTGQQDRDAFAEGMIVTVRHGAADNNAMEIEYRNNLRGPVAALLPGADNVVEILGMVVVVDNATLFSSLAPDDVVEVSGFADNAGRIRATRVFPPAPPAPPPFLEFEVKGFVSGSAGGAFRIGPLPDGSGVSVAVSFPAGGPADGAYVQVVTRDAAPAGGVIAADNFTALAPRTEFPEGAAVELAGLITTPWSGAGDDLSMRVEGKRAVWSAGTEFVGGAPGDARQPNRRVSVRGTENGGTLSADRIVFR